MTTGQGQLRLAISVDADGKIGGLLFTIENRPAPTSRKELDRRLRALAPQVGFLAAEIPRAGESPQADNAMKHP
ncbi:hypothetical protein [Sphaerimonospora thailandensis]|uniref:Uncharacterized protein n=1 Tax=Sphaerimonospora thailandensis TaxID=795644 RepID=A0A8J3W076_9ACTN|nr:hypothetical protein [Sphaerimonospora thailandensis]GIH70561.1 hypothetical protein Mth01_28140 [Sphaerimonospora thailandensis]